MTYPTPNPLYLFWFVFAILTYIASPQDTVPKILTQYRSKKSGPSVVDRDTFMRRWESFTGDILRGVNWSNMIAAGGGVLGMPVAIVVVPVVEL